MGRRGQRRLPHGDPAGRGRDRRRAVRVRDELSAAAAPVGAGLPAYTDRGSGHPVLFLHGQPGLGSDWHAVTALLEADHRVILPDRPGYGASAGPPRGLEGNAGMAAGLLRALGAAPATVVGYSYGAAVALRLAQLHPGCVAGLVLVCPAAGPGALSWADRVLALPGAGSALAFAGMSGAGQLAGWLGRRDPAGAALRGAGLRGMALALTADPLGGNVRVWRSGRSWRTFAFEQRALLAEMPALVADYGIVTAPVAVVAGRRDRVVPPGAIRELVAALHAGTTVWAQAGHLLPWREPELVAGAVAAMAARVGRRPPGSGKGVGPPPGG